jgi:uncharacterized protein YbjT (DUF2867 family)
MFISVLTLFRIFQFTMSQRLLKTFMHNYLGLADSIRALGTFSFSLGDSKTSFVDTRDIGAAAVQALTNSDEH